MQDKAKDLSVYRINSALETLDAAKEDAEVQCENAEKIIIVVKDYLRDKFGIYI